jgi:cytochrome c oxidase subunit III
MAPFLPSDEIEAPSRIDHGGSGTPHHGGGDGDGESGDPYPDHYQNLRRYRLFVFLIFIGVLIFFTALSSAYIIRRGGGHTDWQTGRYIRDWQPLTLPSILWVNTLLLLLSSCTLEIARRNLVRLAAIAPAVSVPGVRRERKLSAPWLLITLALGFGFLAGQYLAWEQLQNSGVLIATNPSSSFFYILTGAHAAHLTGGIIALVYATGLSLFSQRLEREVVVVDVTAWYWHFMGLLWIYIYLLLRVAQ